MSNLVREHVATLDGDTIAAIIRDYETLEETGSVGEGPLRECIAAVSQKSTGMFHQWAMFVALECYRRMARDGVALVAEVRRLREALELSELAGLADRIAVRELLDALKPFAESHDSHMSRVHGVPMGITSEHTRRARELVGRYGGEK